MQKRCACCGTLVPVGANFRQNGKELCSKRCQEYEALRAIERRAGDAFAYDVVRTPWYLVLAAFLAAFMVIYATSPRKSWAHDPNTHLADGFSAAKSKKGDLCCDGKDYTYVSPRSWERTDKGYRIRVHGRWVDVPADALVTNMVNPDGEAKVWLYEEGGQFFARCFMPGAES